MGFISAYLVYVLSEFSKTVNNPMIAGVSFVPVWAITVVFLILMCCGLPCPVLHHIGLVGAYGGQMAYNAGCSEISVLLWGFAFGIFAVVKMKNTNERLDTFRAAGITAFVSGLLTVWAIISLSGVSVFLYWNF